MMYNNQSAFDTVFAHLMQQGCRSVDINTFGVAACRYRGPDELKCAIGVLIPDSEYTVDLEKWTSDNHQFDHLACLQGLNRQLLRDMQVVHDEFEKESTWSTHIKDQFKYIAKYYGLTYTPPVSNKGK